MKYKIGSTLICNVEVFIDGQKKVCINKSKKDSEILQKSFLVIGIDHMMKTYKIIIDDDMVGWIINSFHIKHQHIDEKFINKKFTDITESFILE